LAKYNENDKVKDDDLGKACSMNEGKAEHIQDSGGKARKETVP
jgi:hypothetical protein